MTLKRGAVCYVTTGNGSNLVYQRVAIIRSHSTWTRFTCVYKAAQEYYKFPAKNSIVDHRPIILRHFVFIQLGDALPCRTQTHLTSRLEMTHLGASTNETIFGN